MMKMFVKQPFIPLSTEHVLALHAVGGNQQSVLELWKSLDSHSNVQDRINEGQHYKSPLVEAWNQQIIDVDEVIRMIQRTILMFHL